MKSGSNNSRFRLWRLPIGTYCSMIIYISTAGAVIDHEGIFGVGKEIPIDDHHWNQISTEWNDGDDLTPAADRIHSKPLDDDPEAYMSSVTMTIS